MSGAKIEGFGRRGKESKMVPAENSGLESEVRDEGGEIGYKAVGEGGPEVEGLAGIDAVALEGVAGGDNNWVDHEGAGDGADEFRRRLDFLLWGFLEVDFPLGQLLLLGATAHLPFSLLF